MKKISTLTSTRFFASAAIVFMHSRGSFELTKGLGSNWPLYCGVTFFFVLSGFILTYVYQSLSAIDRRNFYIARFSRIWPAHFISLIIFLVLIPKSHWMWDGANQIFVPIANALLIQSIVPIPEYYFAFNGVSWSISTELFFYIAFPFLISDWRKTYHWKIAISLLVVIAMISMADYFSFPPFSPQKFLNVTSHGLVYISPLVRVFEFILGIAACKIAISYGLLNESPTKSMFRWSAIEIAALVLTFYLAFVLSNLPFQLGATSETALVTYGTHSSSAIIFAALIALLAFQRGILSRILQSKVLILLGEISFSLYLIHQVLLRWYLINRDQVFSGINDDMRLIGFLASCLLLSFLIWRYFELPMRFWLREKLTNTFTNRLA
jgi:peptidoglycan/LPS O-acetylase OafA/YrhL